LQQAVRTPALWLVIGSVTLGALSTGGLALHLAGYLSDAGIEPGLAAGAASMFAIAAAFATAIWGFLVERVSVRGLFVAIMFAAASGVVLLLQARTAPLAYLAAFVIGMTARTQDIMASILIARYYGRRSFGTISGLVGPFQFGALGCGPLLAAWLFDQTGGYQVFLQGVVGAYALAACLVYLARRPRPPAAQPAT
jgi:MFS family permease